MIREAVIEDIHRASSWFWGREAYVGQEVIVYSSRPSSRVNEEDYVQMWFKFKESQLSGDDDSDDNHFMNPVKLRFINKTPDWEV